MISAQTARRAVWRPLWQLPGRFELIMSLARRDLVARYKGSVLGIVWAIVTPVVMIAIFTFIFAGIFGARFGARGSSWDYALYLFCGLLPWTMFQETVQRVVHHYRRACKPGEARCLSSGNFAGGAGVIGAGQSTVWDGGLVAGNDADSSRVAPLNPLVTGFADSATCFYARRRLAGGIARASFSATSPRASP